MIPSLGVKHIISYFISKRPLTRIVSSFTLLADPWLSSSFLSLILKMLEIILWTATMFSWSGPAENVLNLKLKSLSSIQPAVQRFFNGVFIWDTVMTSSSLYIDYFKSKGQITGLGLSYNPGRSSNTSSQWKPFDTEVKNRD